MQQSIYNSVYNSVNGNINGSGITIQATKTNKTTPTTRRASLAQRVAQRWDLVGVLMLMGSSAVYGAFALAHVGL